MPEKWISLNEFMKRQHLGYEVALQMINNGDIEAIKTEGGRYKIKVRRKFSFKRTIWKRKRTKNKSWNKIRFIKKYFKPGRSEIQWNLLDFY